MHSLVDKLMLSIQCRLDIVLVLTFSIPFHVTPSTIGFIFSYISRFHSFAIFLLFWSILPFFCFGPFDLFHCWQRDQYLNKNNFKPSRLQYFPFCFYTTCTIGNLEGSNLMLLSFFFLCRERYHYLVRQCQSMHASIGTGKLAYAVGSKQMDVRNPPKETDTKEEVSTS